MFPNNLGTKFDVACPSVYQMGGSDRSTTGDRGMWDNGAPRSARVLPGHLQASVGVLRPLQDGKGQSHEGQQGGGRAWSGHARSLSPLPQAQLALTPTGLCISVSAVARGGGAEVAVIVAAPRGGRSRPCLWPWGPSGLGWAGLGCRHLGQRGPGCHPDFGYYCLICETCVCGVVFTTQEEAPGCQCAVLRHG